MQLPDANGSECKSGELNAERNMSQSNPWKVKCSTQNRQPLDTGRMTRFVAGPGEILTRDGEKRQRVVAGKVSEEGVARGGIRA